MPAQDPALKKKLKKKVHYSAANIAHRGGSSSSSSDDEPLVKPEPKPKPPPATVRNQVMMIKSQGTKRSRMVIKRPEKPKKARLANGLTMEQFIVEGEVNSDDDSEEDSDAMLENEPLRRAPPANSSGQRRSAAKLSSRPRPNGAGSSPTKAKKAPKPAKPERLGRTKPAKNQKETWPVYDADSYETREAKKLEPEEKVTNWWNRENDDATEQADSATKWITLVHNGVLFPPAYEEHGVGIFYDGKPVKLSGEAEEAATWFAVLKESDHVKNPTFCANFFSDWKKLLGPNHIIKDLSKVDFTPIYDWYQKEKERKAEERKIPENKIKIRETKQLEQSIYGFAIVDGVRQKIANYMVELPGLFRGRGEHPKTGKIKKRIMPEDVILNIGPDEPIPKCPIAGHKWGGITHNNSVTYIARWKDPIQNQPKLVFLHSSSRFKGENDLKKYEVARRLKVRIKRIRKRYMTELGHGSLAIRQRATAVYIIDRLAIRVGNEKDTTETADTVGVCTLRVEHITFLEGNQINLKFLGKDSMQYENSTEVPEAVYRNLQAFCQGKDPKTEIFDRLMTSGVNEYLSELMDGLTAKVFRTYNASHTLQELLTKEDEDGAEVTITEDSDLFQKKYFYDEANRQVAILCNHQKTISSNADTVLEKSEAKLKELKAKLSDLRAELAEAQGKKVKKKKGADPKKRKRNPQQIKAAIQAQKTRIEKHQLEHKMKKSSKGIALGTSKINYMDPRITVAWCKRVEMPIEKIFQRALLDKFPWAMQVPLDFRF